MMRPKVVIEDRLTEEQRKELEKKCQAVDTTDMSALDKAKEIACLREDAQKN